MQAGGGTTAQHEHFRLLTFSTLFPSSVRPRHGIFVETRLRHLVATGRATAEVIAPVPWFPFTSKAFGHYGLVARTPLEEDRFGLRVHHPRYVTIPKLGMTLQPASLAWFAAREIERLIGNGLGFDFIDAHYFYPDGVAAATLAAKFGVPFVVTARGSDINFIAKLEGPRRQIVAAADQAHAVVAVSEALARGLEDLGVRRERIVVLRNGVDATLFTPMDRSAARAALGVAGDAIIASVGNLVPEKGHDLIIAALTLIPRANLLIVGDGPELHHLTAQADRLGVGGRVRFIPAIPQSELRMVYSAADVLALGSSREGWPNVVLEAMACGTPVVSFDVGGVREIISDASVGEIVSVRSAQTMAPALDRYLAEPADRSAVRRHAEKFGWDEVSDGQLRVLSASRMQ